MRKVAVCGHFGFGKTLLNGQTIKTKVIATELIEKLGSDDVMTIDTHGGLLRLVCSIISSVTAMFTCWNMVILPAHNGVRVLGPILAFFRMFSRCKLHYVVIGGWLPQLLGDKPYLARALKKFDTIYVETTIMRKRLEAMGFDNVVFMPNCKKLDILFKSELTCYDTAPFPLCTFSRVMEEKGIEDAVDAVMQINQRYGKTMYTLDIYGPVDPAYKERFDSLQEAWPAYIRYRGCVEFDKSVDVLKNYFALLFPTHFFTEGIPGSIIDAYAAGVPVISAQWESCQDIVDQTTGFRFPFNDQRAFVQHLEKIAKDTNAVLEKKTACLAKAADYLPCNVINILINNLKQ